MPKEFVTAEAALGVVCFAVHCFVVHVLVV